MIEIATFIGGPYDRMTNIQVDTDQKELSLLISAPTIELFGTTQANWDKSRSLGEMLQEASEDQVSQFQKQGTRNYAIYRQRENNRTEYEFIEFRSAHVE